MNKKILSALLVAICAFSFFTACDDDDTYAERRERERKQINAFIKNGCEVKDSEGSETLLKVDPIKVISEEEFYANDSTTDVSKNEYVLFRGSGLYMQIVRKGTGKKLEPGERATILNRYIEFNIATDSISSTNAILSQEINLDVMTCANNYGTFTASFVSGQMLTQYRSSSVPSGWLTPLTFIRLGRQASPDDEIAKVRLIVPSTEGQTYAYNNTYACFYELTYQRGR